MSVTKSGRIKILGGHFAFVAVDGTEDIFVPKAVIETSRLVLAKGDAVICEVEPSARGIRAVSIALID